MRIPRFYQAQAMQVGQGIELTPANFRHAIQVMRLKPGSPLVLFNGEGGEYHAQLTEVGKRNASVEITSFDDVDRESPLSTRLVLALIKPDKMDLAIQKAVEMGVNSIQPVITERSVIRINKSRLDKKIQHWEGVIISACEQSGRTKIPELLSPMVLPDYLKQPTDAMRLVMLPTATQRLDELNEAVTEIELLIGPEGGFNNDEEQLLDTSGITAVTFGPRILRAETAVVAGLTALQREWGDC